MKPPKKTKKVYDVFQNISENYDIMNDVISFGMHRIWKLRAAQEIRRRNCRHILDLCCGTGDMTFLLAKENKQAMVTGVDFSGKMLEVAKERHSRNGLVNVEFVKASAEFLPYREAHFDCVVISFGLRNMADYEKVLRQIFRVLKPGGWIYCLDSSYPENERIRPYYRLYFKYAMPAMAKILTGKGKEYKWLSDSTEQFLSKGELAYLMMKCGFVHVGYMEHLLGAAACHRGQKPSPGTGAR